MITLRPSTFEFLNVLILNFRHFSVKIKCLCVSKYFRTTELIRSKKTQTSNRFSNLFLSFSQSSQQTVFNLISAAVLTHTDILVYNKTKPTFTYLQI